VGYTGHKFDTDLGLSYMQQRYYDPEIGRFYSNDPIGVRGLHSFNRYSYAANNPYKYKDPDGRCFTVPSAVACAFIAVGVYTWTSDIEELGEAKNESLEADRAEAEAYLNCIRSGGTDCNISEARKEADKKRKKTLKKASEASQSSCMLGTTCNRAGGLYRLLNWIFGDDDNNDDDDDNDNDDDNKVT
jgi:RHS repeat-associated protein